MKYFILQPSKNWVSLDSGKGLIGDDATNSLCCFLNYGYATPDVFHSSVRKAKVCWQVDLHG